MTWLQLVHCVGLQYGWTFSDDDAAFILWEHTGFPGFWQTDDPREECRQQLVGLLAR